MQTTRKVHWIVASRTDSVLSILILTIDKYSRSFTAIISIIATVNRRLP